MNQTLEQLIKLQKIDHRLLEIKEHMGDLPSTVESQELEIATIQSENEKKQERITDIDKGIRSHQSEIEDFSNKLEKYKEQLFLVKSNKEYDAVILAVPHDIFLNQKKRIVELVNCSGLVADLVSGLNRSEVESFGKTYWSL